MSTDKELNQDSPEEVEYLGPSEIKIGPPGEEIDPLSPDLISINIDEAKVTTQGNTKKIEFSFSLKSLKEIIVFYLNLSRSDTELDPKTRQGIEESYSFFLHHVKKLEFTPIPKERGKFGGDVSWEVTPEDLPDEKVIEHLSRDYVKRIIAYVYSKPGKLDTLLQENIEESRKKKKNPTKEGKGKIGAFKISGHYRDQTLKYNYPGDKDKGNGQLEIWDMLKKTTQELIQAKKIKREEIVEGIKLSPSEDKIILCLQKLLHKKSQTSTPKKESYYTGNISYDLVEYGGEKGTPAPKLAFSLYELTREYKGEEHPSGKDIENVKNILQELNTRNFLLSYKETIPKNDGGRIENKIEEFQKLISILKLSQTDYNREDIELSRMEETVILLNPIFRRQIDKKFITYPDDIVRRTVIAYGSHNLSDTVIRLRDYLMRELSSKHYTPEIYLDRLYYLLNEKWMKEGRKKKVKEYTEKALETVKALGLLERYEIEPGATYEPKIIFTLNKKWR